MISLMVIYLDTLILQHTVLPSNLETSWNSPAKMWVGISKHMHRIDGILVNIQSSGPVKHEAT